jgi:hypothetical protein
MMSTGRPSIPPAAFTALAAAMEPSGISGLAVGPFPSYTAISLIGTPDGPGLDDDFVLLHDAETKATATNISDDVHRLIWLTMIS